jgi:hypothetical protein
MSLTCPIRKRPYQAFNGDGIAQLGHLVAQELGDGLPLACYGSDSVMELRRASYDVRECPRRTGATVLIIQHVNDPGPDGQAAPAIPRCG